jgi:hypothetical protein
MDLIVSGIGCPHQFHHLSNCTSGLSPTGIMVFILPPNVFDTNPTARTTMICHPRSFHTTTQASHTTTLAQACEHLPPAAPIADTHTATDISAPDCPRTLKENLQLQAHLYSLSTPGDQDKMNFGTDAENICIDTGASACISKLRANFINLRPVTKLQINGIGAGIGTL